MFTVLYELYTRFPSHVWLRIRGDVYGLIVEREGGRLSWYHKQLKETAMQRYGDNDNVLERVILHTIMSKYFSNAYFESGSAVPDLPITAQPLVINYPTEYVWLQSVQVNKRYIYINSFMIQGISRNISLIILYPSFMLVSILPDAVWKPSITCLKPTRNPFIFLLRKFYSVHLQLCSSFSMLISFHLSGIVVLIQLGF